MNKSEIIKQIKEYGYSVITPKKIEYSYYKLPDGTIIMANIHVNHVLSGTDESGDFFGGSSTNIVAAFVPKDQRNPTGQHQKAGVVPKIIDEDIDFETLHEGFSEYHLEDGNILAIKTTVSTISKSDIVSQSGEPIYSVHVVPILKIKKDTQ